MHIGSQRTVLERKWVWQELSGMQSDAESAEIFESKTVHDFKFCSCGACAVDGGHDYLRRCGNLEDWEELSKAEKVEDDNRLA